MSGMTVLLNSCSNIPSLPDTHSLSTQSITQQYYYCESCVKPSDLVEQQYQALEPDAPLPVITPIVLAKPDDTQTNVSKPKSQITKFKRRSTAQKNKKSRHTKKVKPHITTQNKQCIQWSK